MPKYTLPYSFRIEVEAENMQEAIDKANALVKEDPSRYGPNSVEEDFVQ